MIRWLLLGAWLTVVWAALWGEFSPANLISGALVATAALVSFPTRRDPRGGAFRPVAAAKFLGFFLVELVIANVQVAWEVVTPRNRENEGIVALPVVPSASTTLLSLLVNTVGLTPGTMTIDLTESPRVLYVHVLHLDDPEEARRTLMRFQELAVKAFGNDRAVAELDELPLPTIAEDR
ncbi:MAG: Na+/H+ antiporter subunit E [Acidimicrobiales bacterium]